MVEFKAFPKVPRLFRDIVITEKIDGTNAAIGIEEEGPGLGVKFWTQSRKRLITPGDDNFGFSKWAHENAVALAAVLGPGLHFGEWWGSGIQRGYGLEKGEKRFSLFNTTRWLLPRLNGDFQSVPGLDVVPGLYEGSFNEYAIDRALESLGRYGSVASPGFMNPEGIVVFHTASNHVYKVTLENDELPKSFVS